MKRLSLVAFLALLTFAGYAQEATTSLSGYITDINTQETLIGASVYAPEQQVGTVTNNYGHYSLRLPLGRVRLVFNYIGYQRVDTTLNITPQMRLNIALREVDNSLGEVVVYSSRTSELRGLETGRARLSMAELARAPMFMGEADIVKYAQLQPGVARGQEGFSGMIVRGGNIDENLYLVDGNPMYNINHLFGLFSTFNPDAVKSATLYKGSFPARFGGRLSSVLDVRMKDGDLEKYSGTVSVGLISSKVNVEGPIVKGKTSFSLSGRRTYLDLLTRPILSMVNRNAKNENPDDYSEDMFGYNFYDLNGKIAHRFSDQDRVFLSLYMGDDVLDFSTKQFDKKYGHPTLPTDDATSDVRWGSRLASLGWTHLFSPSLFANTTLYWGKYRSRIGLSLKEMIRMDENSKWEMQKANFSLQSSIVDYGLRTDFDYRPHNQHYVRFGGNAIRHNFLPSVQEHNLEGVLSLPKSVDKQRITATEVVLYAEDEIDFSPSLSANIGAHASLLNVEGKTYTSLQPRLSGRFLLLPYLSLKGSYAVMSQYVHLLQSTMLSLPTDLWVPVTARIRPMKSSQYALGLYYDHNGWEASMEGYYKDMRHLIAYKDGAAMYLTEKNWQDRVAIGNGRAYGAEWLIKKNSGRTTGWISYTLSWADRIFPGGEVNRGRRFRDKYDNRHKLNIVLMHKLTPNLEASAVWTMSSGNRMTIATETILDPNMMPKPYYTERNNFQLPAYHRLDLGLTLYRPKAKGRMGVWHLGLYNAYSHHNSFIVVPDWEVVESGSDPNEVNKLLSISIFPILPSLSYTYKF